MPHENPDHRFARAAGKATRAFLDGHQREAERARADRAARAEAQARAERQAAERRRARATAAGSVGVRTARWWWAAVAVVFALLTVSFAVGGDGRPEQYVLAAVTGVLAVATGTGAVQLLRGRRGAAGLLTAIAVIAGVPLAVRGQPLLIAFAVVLLAGAALLWLPAVRGRLR